MVGPLNEALAECFPGRTFAGRPLRVMAEPGQLLCHSAVTLVTSIITKKRAHPRANAAKTCSSNAAAAANGHASNGDASETDSGEGFAYVLNDGRTGIFYWRSFTVPGNKYVPIILKNVRAISRDQISSDQ